MKSKASISQPVSQGSDRPDPGRGVGVRKIGERWGGERERGVQRGPRKKPHPKRKCTITDLESGLPRVPSVGGFGSLPGPLPPPHLSETPLCFCSQEAPGMETEDREARPEGPRGRAPHFLPRALLKGVSQPGTQTVIKEEGGGGMTFTVHCGARPVGWTAASSPHRLLASVSWALAPPTGLLRHSLGRGWSPAGRGPLGAGWARHRSSLPHPSWQPPSTTPLPTSRSLPPSLP